MATPFHTEFFVRDEPPVLIGGVGSGGDADALVARFGNRWRKTPAKTCWHIASPGLQFTIVPYRERWDIAAYRYDTVDEFRRAFEAKTHVGEAVYFQTEPGDKYTGVAVTRWMRENGYL
jgi:hypothetical protein